MKLQVIFNLLGILFVNATLTGDEYPSTEAFIQDQSGNRLFLGAAKEEGGLAFDINGQLIWQITNDNNYDCPFTNIKSIDESVIRLFNFCDYYFDVDKLTGKILSKKQYK